MPATSGSPTQNGTSVTTAAELAGVPDDQFDSGDLAFVADLMPAGRFYLDRLRSDVPDGISVIATFTGNGRWIADGGGGGGGGGGSAATQAFVQPALGANVTVNISSSDTYIEGQTLYIPGGGYYAVAANLGGGDYSLTSLGGTGSTAAGVGVGDSFAIVAVGPDDVESATVDVAGYIQPAVNATVIVPLANPVPSWVEDGQIVYLTGAGFYEVDAIGVNQLTLRNTGATGNAPALTAILEGTIMVPLAQAGQQIGAATPLSFPTIAALAIFNDVAIPDNSAVWVESVRAFWRKKIEANFSLSDDITNIRNPDNTATWYREATVDSSWVYLYYANDCYVDSFTGDDESDGTSALTPLRSLNEISRRLAGDPIAAEISFTINVGTGGLSDYVSDNQTVEQTLVVPAGMHITLSGINANAIAFAAVGASQDYTPATVPQTVADRQQVTVGAGFLWARDRLYINTNDTRQIGWALSGADSGAFGAASADTHFTWSGAPFTAPAVGNVVNEYVLPVADTVRVVGGSGVIIDALEISALEVKDSALPVVRRRYLTGSVATENVNLLTARHCRLNLSVASDTACMIDGGLALLDSVVDSITYVACTSLEVRRTSINGAAVVGGAALLQVVGGVATGSRTTRGNATRVVCDNIELRDNGFLLFGKAAANANMDAAPMDVTLAGTTATPSYIFGRDNVAVTEPIKLLNAGIRVGYNGDAAGTPTAGSGTIVTLTHTGIANTYSYRDPGGNDPTVLVNAGLPSVSANNFVGIYRYL